MEKCSYFFPTITILLQIQSALSNAHNVFHHCCMAVLGCDVQCGLVLDTGAACSQKVSSSLNELLQSCEPAYRCSQVAWSDLQVFAVSYSCN